MLRNRSASLAIVGCSLLCWLTACAPTASHSDQQDEKDPYFQKAKRMYQSRDYKEAVKYYRQALDNNPGNAAAHLELGLLYEDKLQDYSYAIYHYRRYLELRPDAEKKDLVQQFVDRSQLALAASVANSPLDSGGEIVRLRQENSNLLHQVEYLSQTNQVLELRLAKLQPSPEESRQPVIVQTNIFVLPLVTNRIPVTVPSPPTNSQRTVAVSQDGVKPRTYVVQKGDTLSAISQKMYNRRDRWQAIYSANRAVIGPPPSYKLKPGQTLTIPKI